MKKKVISGLAVMVLIFLNQAAMYAQCSMCKATAESDLNNGGASIARGLNTGILYLMAIPYIILGLGAYFFFKKPIDAKLKEWKNKYFPSKKQENI